MWSRTRLALAVVAVLAVLSAGALAYRWHAAPSEPEPTAIAAPEPATQAPRLRMQTVKLRRGDTLVKALIRAGMDTGVAHQVGTALARGGLDLRRLRPRDAIEIVWSPADTPTAVTVQPSPWLGYVAVAEEEGWTAKRLESTPDVRVVTVQGKVERSLFEAIEQAGESASLVLSVVNIFEWDFDFTADTRVGDRFRLIVEKRYAGDSFVNYGRVLAAQYASDKKVLTGIGWTPAKDRFAYYDLDGRSLRKSFLKSPLEFTRITSGFTWARPHPVLGGVRPHLAIDYGAPVGTPVRAVADGLVLRAGWNGGNGIQVHLRHRAGYETIYNHLSRVGAQVRRGARVNQRQVIGYVGSTGLSTGPHLDYRVAKQGTFVNPLGEKFIPGDPIPAAERAEFQRHARDLTDRLGAVAPF
ncbi:MAG TPA: M23 family metallopeptidase [Methylomirabilota bacterium]|nr:M23 family metallopeptidase [Methylomirabilota bacterium]HSF05621.1 M23 family metallopeptidase [Methylomirabilota bacterium]